MVAGVQDIPLCGSACLVSRRAMTQAMQRVGMGPRCFPLVFCLPGPAAEWGSVLRAC
jgi:hypothetical protein